MKIRLHHEAHEGHEGFIQIYTFKLRALRVLRGEISVSTLVAAMPRWVLRGGLLRINYQQRETLQ